MTIKLFHRRVDKTVRFWGKGKAVHEPCLPNALVAPMTDGRFQAQTQAAMAGFRSLKAGARMHGHNAFAVG
jgi:hypothetical protein